LRWDLGEEADGVDLDLDAGGGGRIEAEPLDGAGPRAVDGAEHLEIHDVGVPAVHGPERLGGLGWGERAIVAVPEELALVGGAGAGQLHPHADEAVLLGVDRVDEAVVLLPMDVAEAAGLILAVASGEQIELGIAVAGGALPGAVRDRAVVDVD